MCRSVGPCPFDSEHVEPQPTHITPMLAGPQNLHLERSSLLGWSRSDFNPEPCQLESSSATDFKMLADTGMPYRFVRGRGICVATMIFFTNSFTNFLFCFVSII